MDAPVDVCTVSSEELIKPAFDRWQNEWVRDPEPKRMQGHSRLDAAKEYFDTGGELKGLTNCLNCGNPFYKDVEKYFSLDGNVVACEACVDDVKDGSPSDEDIQRIFEVLDCSHKRTGWETRDGEQVKTYRVAV